MLRWDSVGAWAGMPLRRIAVLAALAAGLEISAAAQGLTGQISGRVLDPSGQAVANATLELVNNETSQTRASVTDATGTFVFTQILRGTYTLSATVPGFKRFENHDIVLSAAERLVLSDVTLQLGEVSQSVSVTAEAARVHTQSAERAGLVTSGQIQELPVKGRDVMDVVRTLPGVVDTGAHEAPGFSSVGGMRINGSRGGTINVALDGVSAVDVGSMGGPLFTPNMDSVAEIKVLLTNYQAEYGRSSGGTISTITKSGSKSFHGSAAYFKRAEWLNANEYFNNRNNLEKPRYRYNYPYYNIGGPVLIPGLDFNRNRDKLFFFWSQDYLPRKLPSGQGRATFPTELERRGDFSRTFDTNGVLFPVLDPLNNRMPFPNNVIPQSRIDPNGQGLLNVFPLPNAFDPNRTYNSVFESVNEQPRHEEILRTDWNVGPKTTFFARGVYGKEWWKGQFRSLLASSFWPQMGVRFDLRTRGLSSSLIHAFNPTLVNEFNFGISRARSQVSATSQEELDRNNREKLGLNVPQFYPQNNPLNVLPNAVFGGVVGASQLWIESRFPYFGTFNTYILSNNITKIQDRHNIKAGIYIEKVANNKRMYGPFNGTYDFSRNVNNPFDANHPFANALLGSVNSYTEASRHPVGHGRYLNFEWFVQDNWRVHRKLTLDVGMRFYRIDPIWSEGDDLAIFSPDAFSLDQAPRLVEPYRTTPTSPRLGRNPNTGEILPEVKIGTLAPGAGEFYHGMQVLHERVAKTPPIQLAPRIGFAWDMFGDGKTAVRGGAGMFYDLFNVDLVLGLLVQPPITNIAVVNYTTIRDLLGTPASLSPSDVFGFERDYSPPRMYNWSFGIQRNVGFGTVLDVSYVGTVGRFLRQRRNLNAVPYGTNFLPSSIDTTVAGNRPLSANFLRPLRGHGDISYIEFSSNSNYHSLQTHVNRRFTQNLMFGLSWTWSKAMDLADSDTVLNPLLDSRMRHYGKSAFDRTHNFVVNYNYQLPDASATWNNVFSRLVLDHWSVSGITTFMSGAPIGLGYSLVQAVDLTGAAGAGVDSRVVLTGNPNLPKSERTRVRHFRTEVVRPPTRDDFGIGNAPKDPIRGPGINNWDISIIKDFPFGRESAKAVQFRWEMYNAFNHTQFSSVDTAGRFDAAGRQVNGRFGEYTAARQARRIQMGLRINF
jgi:hypothetical protein